MIFTLDVRRALKGDCMLLHYGTRDRPGLAIIDGGPGGVYGPHLKPRLMQIKRARGAEERPLRVDMLMVSHVDDDHIHGILDLTKEELEHDGADEARMLNVLGFWHNGFDAIIDHTPEELTATFKEKFGEASAGGAGMSDDDVLAVEEESEEEEEVVRSGLKVLASIEQGFRLRLDAEALGYRVNPPFGGQLVLAREGAAPINAGGGMTLTVVGPLHAELAELHKKHVEWLKDLEKRGEKPPESALAAYVDKSVANLSSIVVLAEVEGKRMLLTGDARGDKVLKGLEMLGLLEPGGTMEVDVLKVPHHGSANNLDNDFFERIIAKHYVFSGDGEHGNPEREALEMLFRARKEEPFVVHLTYPVDEIDKERKKDREKAQAKERKKQEKKPDTIVRDDWSDEKHGLAAFFEQTGLADGQEVRIIPEQEPHLIELLEPVGV